MGRPPRSLGAVKVLTPAKINLGLWVTGRRGDGYHNLVSLFLRINWYDYLEITFHAAPRFSLTSTLDLPEDNTLKKAWILWGESPGVDLHLFKRIPVGVGLGGGSTNAAGLLWALNHQTGYLRTGQDILALAQQVGADVPFFLFHTPFALVRGIGEQILPLPWTWPSSWELYLVLPPCSLSTRTLYTSLSPTSWTPEKKALHNVVRFLEKLHHHDPDAFSNLDNVFFPLSIRFCPIIEKISARLESYGARWISLTGTGSGVLAFFDRKVNLNSEKLDIPGGILYRVSPPPIHPLLPRGVPQSLPGVFWL